MQETLDGAKERGERVATLVEQSQQPKYFQDTMVCKVPLGELNLSIGKNDM